jgi:hypothetical protein
MAGARYPGHAMANEPPAGWRNAWHSRRVLGRCCWPPRTFIGGDDWQFPSVTRRPLSRTLCLLRATGLPPPSKLDQAGRDGDCPLLGRAHSSPSGAGQYLRALVLLPGRWRRVPHRPPAWRRVLRLRSDQTRARHHASGPRRPTLLLRLQGQRCWGRYAIDPKSTLAGHRRPLACHRAMPVHDRSGAKRCY